MAHAHDNIKIAENFTIGDWRVLRKILVKNYHIYSKTWDKAINEFLNRIKLRFLNPIDEILQKNLNKGEGFSATGLMCILMEFIEACYEGVIYQHISDEDKLRIIARVGIPSDLINQYMQLYVYTSSASLFKNLLTKRAPFAGVFSNRLASEMYSKVRCGILHEAATKDNWAIRAVKGKTIVEEIRTDAGEREIVIYRSGLKQAINVLLNNYIENLSKDAVLRRNFVRKMDDICQIRRILYFAYGLNLDKKTLLGRLGKESGIHSTFKGYLNNYTLVFNKHSIDGSAKANINSLQGSRVEGVCYEIDQEAFDRLKHYEKGYDEQDVAIYYDENKFLIAKTFISRRLTDAKPKKEYVASIVEAARINKLSNDYINAIIKCSRIKIENNKKQVRERKPNIIKWVRLKKICSEITGCDMRIHLSTEVDRGYRALISGRDIYISGVYIKSDIDVINAYSGETCHPFRPKLDHLDDITNPLTS